MNNLSLHYVTLNIRYDPPKEIWEKIPSVYSRLQGWLGFAENNLPYWFGRNNNDKEKYVWASVEPGGF